MSHQQLHQAYNEIFTSGGLFASGQNEVVFPQTARDPACEIMDIYYFRK
jgi:hypothetical protein